MRKFAFVLAAIAAVAFSVSATPSAQAYVPHHHHHVAHHHHHHRHYMARNGSQNGGNWSSDRYNGHGINDLGVTTNQGRKNNGG
jgi:Spy/CpxP family protein refolding chaperone